MISAGHPSIATRPIATQRGAWLHRGWWCGLLLALGAIGTGHTADSPAPLKSGRAVGETVPQFYVRAVTGPLMNKSVCYVCRNGDRPVVMIFLRQMIPGTTALLKAIDAQVDAHRADGLKGFCVLLSEDSRTATSRLQTLAFDQSLSLPLTWAMPQIGDAAHQNLHPDAAVTVVLYRNQKVVESFGWRSEPLPESATTLVRTGLERLLATPE